MYFIYILNFKLFYIYIIIIINAEFIILNKYKNKYKKYICIPINDNNIIEINIFV